MVFLIVFLVKKKTNFIYLIFNCCNVPLCDFHDKKNMNWILVHFTLISAYNVYKWGKVKVGKLFDSFLQVMVYSIFSYIIELSL